MPRSVVDVENTHYRFVPLVRRFHNPIQNTKIAVEKTAHVRLARHRPPAVWKRCQPIHLRPQAAYPPVGSLRPCHGSPSQVGLSKFFLSGFGILNLVEGQRFVRIAR